MMHFQRAGLPALFALALLSMPALAQNDGGTTAAGAAATGAMEAKPADPATKPAAPPVGDAGQIFQLPRVGDKHTQIELISGLCGVQMKSMTPLACKCLAEQALVGLSDPQRDYMIATVVAPPVADRMLRDGRIQQPDEVAIFTFINATSDACVSGTYDAAKAKAMTPVAPAMAAPPAAAPAPAAPAVPAPAN